MEIITPAPHWAPRSSRSPLLQNLLLFARLLRALGMRVTSGQVIELAGSLEWIDIGNRTDFRNAARCLLVNRRDDLELFDRAFDAFWRVWVRAGDQDIPNATLERLMKEISRATPSRYGKTSDRSGPARERASSQVRRNTADEEDGESEGDQLVVTIYSPGEMLRHKDFSTFTEDEIIDARRFMQQLRWVLTRRRSMRQRPARRGRALDLRRSLRRSMRHGGEMIDLARRGPKMKRRQLVLLCDISGSMERYTRLLLHFLHSVETNVQRAEVFVFGTRLTRITPELRSRDPNAAINAVTQHVQDWSGGTRIGESLRAFNLRWARRVLGHGAIVMIISDGWDRGDPGLLAAEMERLQRNSYRLIWLNPLLGSTNYRPLTQGIQAALPYIDNFIPVHNLRSLEELAILLNDVQDRRPPRKQVVISPWSVDS